MNYPFNKTVTKSVKMETGLNLIHKEGGNTGHTCNIERPAEWFCQLMAQKGHCENS